MAPPVAARYFTGKPCKNGHVAERWAATSICVECAAEYRRKYRSANPEAHRKSSRDYAKKNRVAEARRHLNWFHNNKDKHAKWLREYRKRPNIAAERSAEAALRRACKRQACPRWVNRKDLRAIYAEARIRTKETGIKHHVDHIVPLVHDEVCGLHVPWNLQVLTAEENLRKSNCFLAGSPL